LSFDLKSLLIGFLAGTATGAAGKYFADKYTDRRRKKEISSQAKKVFLEIKAQMPELIAEMKKDFVNGKHKFVREFFVVPNERCLIGSEKPRFVYYVDQHTDLYNKLDMIQRAGFLFDITTGNTPLYCVTEEFIKLLRKYG
jgi:hypothetical protein